MMKMKSLKLGGLIMMNQSIMQKELNINHIIKKVINFLIVMVEEQIDFCF